MNSSVLDFYVKRIVSTTCISNYIYFPHRGKSDFSIFTFWTVLSRTSASLICLFIIWLAQRVGKMKGILCSDWLPERARFPLDISRFVQTKAKFFGAIFWPYNKSFIDQACSVKMAGYWPSSFLAFIWTETSSRSIKT